MTAELPNKIHQGRNVKRFREMLGLKQDALALELGEEWNQKRISLLESKEVIEPEILAEVAKALNVSEEAIKSFDAETAVNIISNTFHKEAFINSAGTFNINPVEKWLEALNEIRDLYTENKSLYERLLQSEKEKNDLLRIK